MILDRLLAPIRAPFRAAFLGGRRNRPVLEALYGVVMAQARDPYFYARLGVPDTFEGRFDLLVLHVYLVNSRLRGGGDKAQALSQDLFDHMFRDMDNVLREIGVGDMGISKRIQKMASKFYGRVDAYERALGDETDTPLRDAIARNIYSGVEPDPAHVALVAAYVRRARTALGEQSVDAMMEGRLHFPKVTADA